MKGCITAATYRITLAHAGYFTVGQEVRGKVAHTRLPSVGFWSWSRFLAVSLRVTLSHKPGSKLPLLSASPQLLCYQFCCLANRGMVGVNSLPKTVTPKLPLPLGDLRLAQSMVPWAQCVHISNGFLIEAHSSDQQTLTDHRTSATTARILCFA